MNTEIVYSIANVERKNEMHSELLRKSIHMAIAFVPLLASFHLELAMMALAFGAVFYTWSEAMRLSGRTVAVVTTVTQKAARRGDTEGFVLGPVTLAVGAMLALLLYPDPVSAIAIYALAFGDGFAGLVGRIWGKTPLPFNMKKSVEGSLACFLAVFLLTFGYFDHTSGLLIVAASAALIESLSLGDLDNIVMPFGVGLIAHMVLFG